MMQSTDALVTLARRYCMENHEFWCNEYQEKRTGNDYPLTYTDNDYNLFPRYHVLNAILLEVETLTERNFASFSDCQELLVLAGQIADTVFTTGKQNEFAIQAMKEEREKFVAHICSVTEVDLQDVEPLPYARHLNKTESANVRKRLLEHWKFDGGYWSPSDSRSLNLLFVATENISTDDGKRIKEIVISLATNRLYRISEFDVNYQIENTLFSLEFNGEEMVYCDDNYNWIVHVSHDGIVTFGGGELVDCIRSLYGSRTELINAMPSF